MRHRIRTTLAARTLTVACLAAAGALLAPWAASADVGNPGSFTFSMTGGSLQVGLLTFPFPVGPMDGQIDASGGVSIPQSSLQLTDQPFTFSQDEPLVGQVSVTGTATVDTTSLSGTLDPATGAASLTTSLFASTSFTLSVDGSTQYSGTCSIGGSAPADHVSVTMNTDPPGVPYNDQTGAVSLAGDVTDPVCDPALPSLLQFLLNGGAHATLSGTTTPILLPDAHLSVSPSPLDFGDVQVGASKTLTVTLSNAGTEDTFISKPLAFGGQNPGDFTANLASTTCGQDVLELDVPEGGSCTIDVTFTPAATGDRSASLVLTNSSIDGTQTLALTGAGTNAAVSLSASSLDFGQQVVATSEAKTVTVTNTGTTSLTVGGVTASGDFTADATACTAQPVPPGQVYAVTVTFSPTATETRSGTLSITSNAPSSPDTVALTGTGVAPAIAVTPGSLAFGTVPIETLSSPQDVTVTNTGTSGLHVTGPTVSGPFTISADGCSGAAPSRPVTAARSASSSLPRAPGRPAGP